MLHLRRLYLDGWLSYDKIELPLDEPGITLIKGEIGAGKSAIIEAIYYALYGKTLRGKDSVNSLANKIYENGFEIRLYFDIDLDQYLIREVRGRDNHGLWFYKNKEKVMGKTDPETRKIIIDALGLGAEDFKSIAFLGQRQSQLLVEGTPGERAKTLVNIFGLDIYDQIVKSVEGYLNKIHERILSIEFNSSTCFEEQKRIQEEVDRFELVDLKTLNEEVSRLTIEEKDCREKIRKLNDERTDLRVKIKNFENSKRQWSLLKTTEDQIQCIKGKLEKIKEDFDPESESKLYSLRKKQGELTEAMRIRQKESSEILVDTNMCPISQQVCPVNVPHSYYAARVERVTKTLANLRKKYREITAESSELEEKKKKHDLLENIKKDLAVKEEMKSTLLSQGVIPYQDNQQLSSLHDKINYIETTINKQEREAADIESAKVNAKAKMVAATSQQETKERLNVLVEEKKEKIKKFEFKKSKLDRKKIYLAAAIDVFKKTKLYKIDLILETLNFHLDEIMREISNGKYHAEFVSQRLAASGTRKLDKLGILVHDKSKSIPIELCSGGQVTEVGLAVLLSVWKTARTLSNKTVSSLWLDEAFNYLDEEIIDRVFKVVVDIAKESGATSVKVISHRDLDTRIVDNFWNVSLTNGVSSLTII